MESSKQHLRINLTLIDDEVHVEVDGEMRPEAVAESFAPLILEVNRKMAYRSVPKPDFASEQSLKMYYSQLLGLTTLVGMSLAKAQLGIHNFYAGMMRQTFTSQAIGEQMARAIYTVETDKAAEAAFEDALSEYRSEVYDLTSHPKFSDVKAYCLQQKHSKEAVYVCLDEMLQKEYPQLHKNAAKAEEEYLELLRAQHPQLATAIINSAVYSRLSKHLYRSLDPALYRRAVDEMLNGALGSISIDARLLDIHDRLRSAYGDYLDVCISSSTQMPRIERLKDTGDYEQYERFLRAAIETIADPTQK